MCDDAFRSLPLDILHSLDIDSTCDMYTGQTQSVSKNNLFFLTTDMLVNFGQS